MIPLCKMLSWILFEDGSEMLSIRFVSFVYTPRSENVRILFCIREREDNGQ